MDAATKERLLALAEVHDREAERYSRTPVERQERQAAEDIRAAVRAADQAEAFWSRTVTAHGLGGWAVYAPHGFGVTICSDREGAERVMEGQTP